jgi:hypothetical protein
MDTLQTVFLGVAACALALFFLIGSVVLVLVIRLVSSIKQAVYKAEDAIDSAHEATEIIRTIGANASGPLALYKIIRNIMNMINRRK